MTPLPNRLRAALAFFAVIGLVSAAPRAGAQTISDAARPHPANEASATWSVDHVEAPTEIAIGTMAIRIWVRVSRTGTRGRVDGLTLVLPGDGNERIPMEPVDGAFDSEAEEAVATIDTYAWVRDAAHTWEVYAQGHPTAVARGTIRVRPRISTPDLVLVDTEGRVQSWLGSGAGGFSPGPTVLAGVPVGPLYIGDVNSDRRIDVLLPADDGLLHLFTYRGSGRLEETRTLGLGPGLVDAAFGDVDGDGGSDLVAVFADRRLELRRDLEDFPGATLDLPFAPDGVALADLDGDGRQEVYMALLGLSDGELHAWRPPAADDEDALEGVLETVWDLSPPERGRARIRSLVPLRRPGGDALLVLSGSGSEGMLESWVFPADIEAVPAPRRERLIRVEGEPLGAVTGRFSDPNQPSWLVWIRSGDRVELLEVPLIGTPRLRGELYGAPSVVSALDLDGDGDDDLVAGGEDLRLWINIQGGDFREAGESPYLLDSPVVALASGSLDE